jgi:putative transcriptional regulator
VPYDHRFEYRGVACSADQVGKLMMAKPGRVINAPKFSSIREKTVLSQARFGSVLGVSIRTLQDCEQGRRAPSVAARTLLIMVGRNPAASLEVA